MAWKSTLYSVGRVLFFFVLSLLFLQSSFAQQSPNEGPGGPILVVGSTANPFSRYAVEILRAEGLNEFDAVDISTVNAELLNQYEVVILGDMPIGASLVSTLSTWTNNGGVLISFRPAPELASLLGLMPVSGNMLDKYLTIKTNSGPGAGIVNQSIQYHGTADLYKTMSNVTTLATLYADANTATVYPAVTSVNVGTNGGKAIAFTYDLARSIVYTRQGNPAWAGQKRDGTTGPIRTDDMFFGTNGAPDWIDFNKVAIPQADEQQRLLVNIILQGNLHHKPLPRFWFLPRGLKAAIVMTGDDHKNNGTEGRFNLHKTQGPNTPQDVADWKAVRASSYIFNSTPITNEVATAFVNEGFEIALHANTGCVDFNESNYRNTLSSQIAMLREQLPGVPSPVTNRNHCIAWSDWATAAKVEADFGIRLDVNYYYWPAPWVLNRAGMFTGSGMPMRFANLDGSLIDCYQVTTQMTDESGIDYTGFTNQLLNRALGAEGYYGVFCANMHTDSASHIGANSIIAAAKARQVPIIAAKQMLTWLDGRNNSSFDNLAFNSNQLSFTINKASGANGLKAMLPLLSADGKLTAISANGSPVSFYTEVIKGIEYAFFDVNASGNYLANYGVDATAPSITDILATPAGDGSATISWHTNETANSRVDFGTNAASLTGSKFETTQVSTHSILLPGLEPGRKYYFRVSSTDAAGNNTQSPAPPDAPLSFIMPAGPCFVDRDQSHFKAGQTDANMILSLNGDGEMMLKPLLNEEFNASTLPSGWSSSDFNPGATSFDGTAVTVNGTHIFSNTSFGPGTSLDFVGTFNQASFQNVGFSIDQPFNGTPWVAIGQGNADGKLYARSSDGTSISLGTNLFGTPHRYRIQWNASSFDFYVDNMNTAAAKINITIGGNMYVQVSDVMNNDGSLSVDWLRASPYAAEGTFLSRIVDAGSAKNWGAVSWNAETPTGTKIAISVRTGNTALPDESWVGFTNIANAGDAVGRLSRYIQYKADFSSTDRALSPVLKDITINCESSNESGPGITQQPNSQAICLGNKAGFTSMAAASPDPVVQWQVSTDGTNWSNIAGANSPILTFTPVAADNQKKYRAAWSNSVGTVYSDVATLTVNPVPVLSSPTFVTTVSGEQFNYTATSSTAGTSFKWSRAVVAGIDNPAANGNGNISEVLNNPGTVPVKTIYVVTSTSQNCSSSQQVEVMVAPAPVVDPGCSFATSIGTNFNGTSIPAGRYIWFNAIFKAKNLGSGPVNINVTNSKISYVLNGQTITLAVPNAHISFASNNATQTQFVNGVWETTVPLGTSVNVFLTGLSYKVPASIPGNSKNIVWTADIKVDKPGATIDWKWTAGVYGSFSTNHAALNVKTADGLLNILNPLLGVGSAGTPLNYYLGITSGAMGAGLLNITSTFTAYNTLACPAEAGRLSTGRAITESSSIEEASKPFEVRLMPNPSSSYFTLRISGTGLTSVRVLDMLGQQLEKHEAVQSTLQLGTSWKAGTYFAEVRQGKTVRVLKLVKIN